MADKAHIIEHEGTDGNRKEVSIMTFGDYPADLPADAQKAIVGESEGRFFNGLEENNDIFSQLGLMSQLANNQHYVPFGTLNNLDSFLKRVLMQSPIGLPTIKAINDLVKGTGIGYFYEVTDYNTDSSYRDEIKIPEIDFFIRNCFNADIITKLTTDFLQTGNAYSVFIPDNDGKVQRIEHKFSYECRVGQTENFRVLNYYMGDFANHSTPNYYLNTFPSNINYIADTYDYTFDGERIFHHMNYVGIPYYGLPNYIGALKYMKLLSMIPDYHIANLDKGTFIRWHIQIPRLTLQNVADSFKKKKNSDGTFLTAEECMEAAIQKYTDIYKKHLSSRKNNGAIMTSAYDLDGNGKATSGVIITPLNITTGSNDYIELFKTSLMGAFMGFGIDGALAGLDVGGNLSSGSETLYKVLFFQNSAAIGYSNVILDTMNLVAKINNYREKYPYPKNKGNEVVGELKFEIKRPSFARLAQNKTGISN